MRLQDWRSKFQKMLAEKENQPFAYGKNDCALFGADVVFALTGNDPALKYRGKYRSLSGGLKLIKKDGFKNQIDYVVLNFKEIPPAFSGIGDIGIANYNGQDCVVAIAGTFAVAVGEFGLVRIDLETVNKFYKV
ncbi:DUF6950 family protein [Pseudogemmobacter bohemicus]|uniref:DUF6950 family protein n=1 Tax=Pseudogemmobacter bohemicus TaxID=2250708 RepID=UPI001300679A|nr:hypothetical protein [Pseudogemmobacter bohemicus]